jgi:sulfate/thiosulfate transport system ATP-binding protein
MNVISTSLDHHLARPLLMKIRPVALRDHRRGSSGKNRIYKETAVAIAVRHLSKRYGTFQAVDDVSFDVPAGQLVALLGPSGSGKSTILRIIAGLETAETGSVELTGEDATEVPIQHRGVGFVFQHYALFRHMTVRENIAFGLKVRKLPKAEIRARVDALLDLVQLSGYALRYPSQLSGGQRQRVALARALAPRPKVLLLDEPFGALDAKVRDELRTWLRRLHDEVHVTSLFVTHDQQEAFEVADQVVVLNRGRIEQMGPPQVLYEQPRTPFVTEFLGSFNVLKGQTGSGMTTLGDGNQVPSEIDAPDGPVSVYVRPHDLDLTRERNGRASWAGKVTRVTPLGASVRIDIELADSNSVRVELTRQRYAALEPHIGETIFVAPRDVKVFLDQTQPII